MDPWLWLMLGVGWLLGRQGTRGLVITFAVMATLLFRLVATRAPNYLPAVALVAALLLFALLLRLGGDPRRAQRVAVAGLALAGVYIISLIGLHAVTEHRVRADLAQQGIGSIERLMVGPRPANPLAWDVVAESGDKFRYGRFSWSRGGSLELADTLLPTARSSILWDKIEQRGQSRGFLRWVRFPWLEIESDGTQRRVYLMDARYRRQRTRGFGGTVIELPPGIDRSLAGEDR
jgi:hypothetical protein